MTRCTLVLLVVAVVIGADPRTRLADVLVFPSVNSLFMVLASLQNLFLMCLFLV